MKKILSPILFFLPLMVFSQTNHWETAVYETDTWRYVVPTVEPDTNWRKIGFNATSWLQGAGGIGYADGDDNTVVGTTASVFMMITFNVTDTSKISSAMLNVDYDDGFVAYLNNVEIQRTNITAAARPAFNALASSSHEAVMYQGGNPDYFYQTTAIVHPLLKPGINVLAIQAHNFTANSSDLSSRVWLSFGIRDNSVLFGPTPTWFVPPFEFYDSNLPIVVLNTNNQTIGDYPKIMCDMGVIYNGVGNRNALTDPWNNYSGKAGVEFRGSSSQSFPKKSYAIELWNNFQWQIDSSLVGMPAESDWCLIANYTDKSLLNNSLSYYLSREMGWPAARWEFVELVINGQYIGVYLLCEKIKRGPDRVDISKLTLADTTGDAVTGGYIIKVDKQTASSGLGWTSSFAPDTAPNGQTIFFQYDYPTDVYINQQQKIYIAAYVDSFETALAGPNFRDTTIGYHHYADENSFVDYFLVNEMSKNVDGYRLSTFLFKDRDSNGGKLTIGPVWDYDIAWGNANYCSGSNPAGWAYDFATVCPGDYWEIPFWWDRFLQDTAFQNKVACRWEELKYTILSKQFLYDYCDSMGLYLDEGQIRNFTAWPILGTYVWPNPSPIPTTYQGEIDELKNWIDLRWNWMDANMPGNLNGCNPTGIATQQNSNTDISNAYPNPFTNTVNLSIYLAQPQMVEMELINALGQVVQPIQTQMHNGGTETIIFNSDASLPPGIYLLRIRAGNKTWTQQLSKVE